MTNIGSPEWEKRKRKFDEGFNKGVKAFRVAAIVMGILSIGVLGVLIWALIALVTWLTSK